MHLRFPPRPGRLVARALLTAAVAGCSAEATDDRNGSQEARTAATGAVPEAARAPGCELITAAEITAATGKVPARSEGDDTNLRGCSWYDADGSPILGLTIGAAPRTYEDYLQSVREQTEEMASLLEGVDTSTVAGIGDYAIWHETEGASYLNAARDGELFTLMIFTEPEGGQTKREAVLELASKGVPRM
jgi:hypothetical protein